MFPFRQKKVEEQLPKKRRKKVEPPKPWGKLERVVVFAFLAIAPILSVIFFIHSKDSKSTKLISINSNVLSDVISQNPPDINLLKSKLIDETQSLHGTYGIWIQALDGSFTQGINENMQFSGSSLFKLPLMMSYYKEVDKGTIDPTSTYTIKYSDTQTGSGSLANMPPGATITYQDIVKAMAKDADNTAFSIMSNIVDPNSQINLISQIGMNNTDFSKNLTTAKDMGLLFYKLDTGTIISTNARNELLSFLQNSNSKDYIADGIPEAGIIYSNKPFILVILSKNTNENEQRSELPKISKIVYDWENSVK